MFNKMVNLNNCSAYPNRLTAGQMSKSNKIAYIYFDHINFQLQIALIFNQMVENVKLLIGDKPSA